MCTGAWRGRQSGTAELNSLHCTVSDSASSHNLRAEHQVGDFLVRLLHIPVGETEAQGAEDNLPRALQQTFLD